MPETSYSYLDLTVLPALRRKVLSGDAAILFTSDMLGLLWANAAGALLFGGAGIAEMIASPLNANQPFVQQLSAAARQIEGDEPIVRGFRIARGLRTELIQCELARLVLPAGDEAILLTCRDEKLSKPMREHELAENAVESLSGFADAAAILDDYGLPLAATSSFAELEIDPGELAELVSEASHESDRLIKRAQAMADGSMLGIGIARISDRPGRYLVVCASGSSSSDQGSDKAGEENGDAPSYSTTTLEDDAARDFDDADLETPEDHQQSLFDDRTSEADGAADAGIGDTGDYVPETAAEDIPEDYQEEQQFHGLVAEAAEMAGQTGQDDNYREHDLDVYYDEDTLVDAADLADLGKLDGNPSHDAGDDDETQAADPKPSEPKTAGRSDADPDTLSRSILERWYFGTSLEGKTASKTAAKTVAAQSSDDKDRDGTGSAGDVVESDQIAAKASRSADEGTAAVNNVSNSAEDRRSEDRPFVYRGDGQPVRFAWIIDSDQVFRSVSPELAQTVGPNASDIIGRRWADVARVFGFDRSGEIGRLLEKRDTWSGKSVFWPVQGTDLAVPIDLAALPAFDSNRRFDGFRGFGIIRTADAIVDPEETGRSLDVTRNVVAFARDEDKDIEARNWSAPAGEEAYFDWDDDAKDALHRDDDSSAGGQDDEQQENAPVAAKAASNVVELTSRLRTETSEPLNRRESQAFSEIGQKLREDEHGPEEQGAGSREAPETASSVEDSDFAAPDAANDLVGNDAIDPDRVVDDLLDDQDDLADEHGYQADHQDLDDLDETASHVDTSILEQLPAPVLVYRNGATLFVNSELLKLTGYSNRDEFARAGGVDAILSGTDDDGDENANGRTTLICKDGSSLPINPLLQTVPWDGGKALLLTFRPSSQDRPEVNVERAALDIARVSELQNILDTATDGIIVMDRDGIVESVNASAEALFGTDFDKAKGRNLTEFFAQESHKTIHDYISEITQPGVAGILNDGREVIGKEANGGLIPLFITIGRMGSDDKLCLVLRDMTQWKKAEEELVGARRSAELASEQKSDFLARVSHEIRTPLNAIIGFSDIMIEERFGPVGNERYREYLRDINRSGVHVLDLINDLLDISKIEAGKMELTYEAVDLNQIASETVALLQPQANRERIIIRTSLSRAVPRVVADARSIRQIILNLVSNAIKFTPMNGQVIVSTVYEGNGEVALRVRDTGRGMSEKEIESAMKPFQQIGAVEEKRGQGTGLGLPLTKALVEANRAYFDIESKPGEGTIAHVHFPIQRVLAD
ncbi:MAG: PAS domain-containing sensor histidine kinase [Nitratireductor sp.]